MSALTGLDGALKAAYADRYDADAFNRPYAALWVITGEEKFRPTWKTKIRWRWYRARVWVARKVLRVDMGDDE